MKKFAAVIAVAVLVAFAAPAFASINPFMDVPMNHWAYDAIGQLAAHGILSGYPDGTYKGKQPTTRYEMASALARALAVVDMTKASKQDVEMLKRLVIEFKDELEALGVRVDDLDERVSLIESRLGGWKLTGRLRQDITYNNSDSVADGTAKGNTPTSMARIWIERWFGDPDNQMHFKARIDAWGGDNSRAMRWSQFYVEVPAWFETILTFGRFGWDMGSAYYIGGDSGLGDVGGYGTLDSVLTDRNVDGIGITKNFGLGSFQGYLSHTNGNAFLGTYDAWEAMMMAKLQFTEQIGVDLGAQVFAGDNSDMDDTIPGADDITLDFHNMWTAFVGLRFNFMDGVAFKGIFYHQQFNGDSYTAANGWEDADYDSANHWRLIVDVNQDVLKFTSAWLEYGQMDTGFVSPAGLGGQGSMFSGSGRQVLGALAEDMKYWRVALAQQWTEKWGTHLFYYGYGFDELEDLSEWGLGVTYKYNDNVKFGLNYVNVDYKGDDEDDLDESKVRFRTQIDF